VRNINLHLKAIYAEGDPDGRQLAAIAAQGSGDDNWWIAQLYTVISNGGDLFVMECERRHESRR
jgi:hypothetical protein